MEPRSKIFFASDLHLGAPDYARSLIREKHFVAWLDAIKPWTRELYLLGDVFDFWFEYNKAVPKGFVRIQGKLAEFTDAGIPVHFFSGNHDLWLRDYFPHEIGMQVHYGALEKTFFGKKFFMAHGDGLGPGDRSYKLLKWVFQNPVCQWSFHRLHPNFGIGLASFLSRRSRARTGSKDEIDYGKNEYLLLYSQEVLKTKPEIDYFVYGHRHLPKHLEFETGKYYINLGDWIHYFSYLELSEAGVFLRRFLPEHPVYEPDAGTDAHRYPVSVHA